MLVIMNILSIPIFIGIAYLFSNDKKNIQWRSVVTVLAID